MKVPIFKAKDIDSDKYYTGFYFSYPSTTYCITSDYLSGEKVKNIHCLVSHTMTDWGLPNRPILITIDNTTLEQVGYVDTEENIYIPKVN